MRTLKKMVAVLSALALAFFAFGCDRAGDEYGPTPGAPDREPAPTVPDQPREPQTPPEQPQDRPEEQPQDRPETPPESPETPQ